MSPLNLLPNAESFTFWSPTDAQTPVFFKEDHGVLGAQCINKPHCFGKWIGRAAIQAGETYTAAVECSVENMPMSAGHDANNVYAMLNWLNKDGTYLRREYLEVAWQPEGSPHNWIHMTCTTAAPENAVTAEIELTLSTPGTVRWRNNSLTEAYPIRPRPVRIASAFFTPRRNLALNLETMLALADQAGQMQADVLLFTESCYDRGVTPIQAKAVPIPSAGPDDVLGQLGAKAKQYSCNILVNITECENGFFFNSTVLLDRNGQYIGKYRKSHLPIVEKEAGFSPGNELPVFVTDFATIGVMTCFDLAFMDIGRTLRNKGAQLIFVPTIGNFMLYSQMLAKDTGMYVVVSGGDMPHPSRIINPNGDIIACVDGTADGIAFMEIDLSKNFYSPGTGFFPAASNARNALYNQRRHELYRF